MRVRSPTHFNMHAYVKVHIEEELAGESSPQPLPNHKDKVLGRER